MQFSDWVSKGEWDGDTALDCAAGAWVFAEQQAATAERDKIIAYIERQEKLCGETCAKLEVEPEGSPMANMYWRADGAADMLEHLADDLRSNRHHENQGE